VRAASSLDTLRGNAAEGGPKRLPLAFPLCPGNRLPEQIDAGIPLAIEEVQMRQRE